MATTTHHLLTSEGRYVNASNGNLNCLIVAEYPQQLRLHFGGEEPAIDTPDYVALAGMREGEPRIITVTDLGAESDVWVRAEQGSESFLVIRGEAKIIVA